MTDDNDLINLRLVREILSDPSRWTTHASARDSEGLPVRAESDHAVCWCVSGAYQKVYDTGDPTTWVNVRGWNLLKMKAYALYQFESIVDLNDSPDHGYPAVMRVIDETIKDLECS